MSVGRPKLGAALAACVLLTACEGPTGPTPGVPNPPPPPFDPRPVSAQLAGSYEVTLNVPGECTALPDAVRRRRYRGTLETAGAYLAVRVAGGGFADPVVVGELRAGPDGQFTISWNDFDIGGCDGYPEPLSDGSRLMVCGKGSGRHDGSTITGTLTGSAWIDDRGNRGRVCNTTHQFTFTRATP